jgi:hypothetical protein
MGWNQRLKRKGKGKERSQKTNDEKRETDGGHLPAKNAGNFLFPFQTSL